MSHFHKIAQRNSAVANYLQEIGFDRWSRAYFPGKWFFIMASNYARCFKSRVREAQKWPITFLLEYIRSVLQLGNYTRQKYVENCTTKLLPKLQKMLMDNLHRAKGLQTCVINTSVFKVLDARGEMVVNVLTRKCSCGKFQIFGIPCEHAVAACLKCGVDIYSLCSMYHKRENFNQIYVDTIYSPGVEDKWNVPDVIANAHVGMPVSSVINADQQQGKDRCNVPDETANVHVGMPVSSVSVEQQPRKDKCNVPDEIGMPVSSVITEQQPRMDKCNVPDDIANARVGMPVSSVIVAEQQPRKRRSAD